MELLHNHNEDISYPDIYHALPLGVCSAVLIELLHDHNEDISSPDIYHALHAMIMTGQ